MKTVNLITGLLVVMVMAFNSCEEAVNFIDDDIKTSELGDSVTVDDSTYHIDSTFIPDSSDDIINDLNGDDDSLDVVNDPGDSSVVNNNQLLNYLNDLIASGTFNNQSDSAGSFYVTGYDADDPNPELIIGTWELYYYFINGEFEDTIKVNHPEVLRFEGNNIFYKVFLNFDDSVIVFDNIIETGYYQYLPETYNKIVFVNTEYEVYVRYVADIDNYMLRFYYIDIENNRIMDCVYKRIDLQI